MKKRSFFRGLSLLMVTLFISGSIFAQAGRGQRPMRANQQRMDFNQRGSFVQDKLNLSEEQQEKMKTLRAEHMKEMRYEQSLLDEKNAKLNTLLASPEKDNKAVDQAIDEIAGQKARLMKMKIANKEEMKGILTPEQVETFEALGLGKNYRDGLRGKRGPDMRNGRRGDFGPRGMREFHGRN